MRVLVATDFLEGWSGSEVMALEVAEHFGAVATSYWGQTQAKSELENWRPIEEIDLGEFDLVWAQHHVLLTLLNKLDGDHRPFVIWATLSPYDDMEQIPPSLIKEYVDIAVANSAETAKARGLEISFENAAPRKFHFEREQRTLKNILFVSNNQPDEMLEAASLLKRKGHTLRFIGRDREVKRIEPADIAWADCVVTIGKTVRYALASSTPVFLYDRFGGDGYVTDENYALNAEFNFSGRPNERRLTSAVLADEIVAQHSYWTAPPQLVFEDFLDELASKAAPQPFKRVEDLRANAAMADSIGQWLIKCRSESIIQSNAKGYRKAAGQFVRQKAPQWMQRLLLP
ncbi:hypothetical protein ACRAQ7_03365 [Erythrobacter sp. W53]|uniref:hypothetical protein n=1 Tax=Erythrobacter sp. W53 TaxID=3425947 RepID=UPI003D767574